VGTKIKIDLIGISQNIAKIRKLTDQVADTDLNIVVYGETGVGKEVVVRSLYEKSKRCGKPFVKVNCAALPGSTVLLCPTRCLKVRCLAMKEEHLPGLRKKCAVNLNKLTAEYCF
jgi:sigma54-dependent transcription regulator